MTQRLRRSVARILLLIFFADIMGVGAVSTLADFNDRHSAAAAGSVADDGSKKEYPGPSGCNHACHFAQHFVAPISVSPVPSVDVSTSATPLHPAVSPSGIRHKALFHPPRALA